MKNEVLFIKGYHQFGPGIEKYLELGYTVYNAPRPLYGHATWMGNFRHGVFYAAVMAEGDPADEFSHARTFHERNRELDGWPVVIVGDEELDQYGVRLAEEYDIDVSSYDRSEVIRSYLNWREMREG